jgi:hypothetical protein
MTDIKNPAPCSQHGHRAGLTKTDVRSNTAEPLINQPPSQAPRLRLLDWTPIGKGALIGKAKIWMAPGFEISDIAIFEKAGRRWAQLPSEMMRDRDGQPITDESGRNRYRSAIRWESRELQDRWSDAVVALVSADHGGLT